MLRRGGQATGVIEKNMHDLVKGAHHLVGDRICPSNEDPRSVAGLDPEAGQRSPLCVSHLFELNGFAAQLGHSLDDRGQAV
jgi:hypothetical protein